MNKTEIASFEKQLRNLPLAHPSSSLDDRVMALLEEAPQSEGGPIEETCSQQRGHVIYRIAAGLSVAAATLMMVFASFATHSGANGGGSDHAANQRVDFQFEPQTYHSEITRYKNMGHRYVDDGPPVAARRRVVEKSTILVDEKRGVFFELTLPEYEYQLARQITY